MTVVLLVVVVNAVCIPARDTTGIFLLLPVFNPPFLPAYLTECINSHHLTSAGGHLQSAQTNQVGILKGLFSSLRDSVASSGGGDGSLGRGRLRHELNGVFSKLIEPEQFRRIALSRLSEEERSRAPSSLQVNSKMSLLLF